MDRINGPKHAGASCGHGRVFASHRGSALAPSTGKDITDSPYQNLRDGELIRTIISLKERIENEEKSSPVIDTDITELIDEVSRRSRKMSRETDLGVYQAAGELIVVALNHRILEEDEGSCISETLRALVDPGRNWGCGQELKNVTHLADTAFHIAVYVVENKISLTDDLRIEFLIKDLRRMPYQLAHSFLLICHALSCSAANFSLSQITVERTIAKIIENVESMYLETLRSGVGLLNRSAEPFPVYRENREGLKRIIGERSRSNERLKGGL